MSEDEQLSTIKAPRWSEDSFPYIQSITFPPNEKGVSRDYKPTGASLRFRPVLKEYDVKIQQETRHETNGEIVIYPDENGFYYVPVKRAELSCGPDDLYTGYFILTDNAFLIIILPPAII